MFEVRIFLQLLFFMTVVTQSKKEKKVELTISISM